MSGPGTDLRRFDLNLLPVFMALMRERSVTRAGKAMFLSQPATSAALARLRAVFRDELFIRNGRVLEPTRRAEELLLELAPAMQSVAAAVAGGIPFDPATDARTFHIGTPEDIAYAGIPAMRSIRAAAPHCRVVVHAANFRTIPGLLEAGEIGTAIGFIDDSLPAATKRRVLRRGSFRVLRDAASPGPVDLDMYCARQHVLVTPRGDLHGFADDELAKLGRARHVVVGIPDFGLLPRILHDTDLLCTVSTMLTDALVADSMLRLAADPLPFPSPVSVTSIAWRAALDHDPAESWIRGQLIAALSH